MNFQVFGVLTLLVGFSSQHPAGRRRMRPTSSIDMWDSFEDSVSDTYNQASGQLNPITSLLHNQIPAMIDNEASDFSREASMVNKNETDGSLISSVEEFLSNNLSNALSSVSDAEAEAKNYVAVTYSEVSSEVSKVATQTEGFFTTSWNSASSWFSGAATSVGDFFSSSWNSIRSWWTKLEEEVKDFIHLCL